MNNLQLRTKPNSGCGCNANVKPVARTKPNSGCGCSAVLFQKGSDSFMAMFKDGVFAGAVRITE